MGKGYSTPQIGLIGAVASGTILEWYDAFLFAVGARYIASNFFPSKDPFASLMNTFLAFALGFFARPFGALFFGWLGDKIGRKTALFWTLILAGISTFLIGVIPNYAMLGVLASIIVVVLRLLQGFALGGEWGSAVSYLYESVKRKRLYMIFVQSGVPLGLLLASLIFYIIRMVIGEDATAMWGWRIPFLLSIIIAFIGLYLRYKLGEAFEYIEAREKEKKEAKPLVEVFKTYLLQLIIGIFLAGAAGAVFYYGNTFLPNIATTLKLIDSGTQFIAITLFAVFDLIGIIMSGYVAEKIGIRPPLIVGLLLFVIAALSIDIALTNSGVLLGIAVLSGFAHGIIYTPEAAFLAELFPILARNTGVSASYQLGNTIFAGTAPYIMSLLLPYGRLVAATYLLVVTIIALLGILLYRRS